MDLNAIYIAALALLSIGGLIRVLKGPPIWDRLLGFGLFSSKIIIISVLLGFLINQSYMIDVALIYGVLGLIGTFFYVNNNSLIKTNIKSDLQKEGEAIQNQLIKVAQQSKDIKSIEIAGGMMPVDASTINYDSFINGANTDIREITFNQINDLGNKVPYTFALNARKWKHAFGGDLLTNGTVFSNGVTTIGNGGTHEESPYEGV